MYKSWQCVSRAAVSPSGTLHGYAAAYGVPTTKQNQFPGTETIARGAFDDRLQDDVLANTDHNPSAATMLGRTSSGTLRLSSDDYGLGYEIDLPDTQAGRDLRTLVERGDIRGASFRAAMNMNTLERTASGVVHHGFNQLLDICITAVPAYDETDVAARFAAEQQSLRGQLAMIRHRVLLGGDRVR